jgi:hypothetical protein
MVRIKVQRNALALLREVLLLFQSTFKSGQWSVRNPWWPTFSLPKMVQLPVSRFYGRLEFSAHLCPVTQKAAGSSPVALASIPDLRQAVHSQDNSCSMCDSRICTR